MSARRDERPRSLSVAVLAKRGRFLIAEPLFERGPRPVVDRHHLHAGPGELVLVRSGPAAGRGRGRATVERALGRPDVARDVIEALMLDRGLARGFDRAVRRAAREGAADGGVALHDLRDLPTLTIDPASARDFDDAISARRLGDGAWRIHVHIADVSAHVRAGSPVDREAYERGTSVYVPGAVEPMLPEVLSNGACSLVPGEDRRAVSVEIDLRGAEVTRTAFHRSLIRSDARLDYDLVDRVFAGREGAREPWGESLAAAREAAAALAAARARRHALVIDSAEPDFSFDGDGNVTEVRPVAQTEAHRLIEHLMIAANEQVAGALARAGVPALYRVHAQPDPQAVERLVDQLASLGVATPPLPRNISPQQATDLVGEASALVAEHVRRSGRGRAALSSLVLRALKQAAYDPRNLGHAGLRSQRYCHFTSPIRRYPDLICHRALLSITGGGEQPPRAEGIAEAAVWTSQRERDAIAIERDADDVARCFLLERELRDGGAAREHDGEVIGVIGAGAFVAFGDGYEGMLPVRRMRGDWFELNEQGTILHGTRSGRTIRLGDPLRVRVERIDAPRGRVDLVLAGGGDDEG